MFALVLWTDVEPRTTSIIDAKNVRRYMNNYVKARADDKKLYPVEVIAEDYAPYDEKVTLLTNSYLLHMSNLREQYSKQPLSTTEMPLVDGSDIMINRYKLNDIKRYFKGEPRQLTRMILEEIVGQEKLSEMNASTLPDDTFKAVERYVNTYVGKDKILSLPEFKRCITLYFGSLKEKLRKKGERTSQTKMKGDRQKKEQMDHRAHQTADGSVDGDNRRMNQNLENNAIQIIEINDKESKRHAGESDDDNIVPNNHLGLNKDKIRRPIPRIDDSDDDGSKTSDNSNLREEITSTATHRNGKYNESSHARSENVGMNEGGNHKATQPCKSKQDTIEKNDYRDYDEEEIERVGNSLATSKTHLRNINIQTKAVHRSPEAIEAHQARHQNSNHASGVEISLPGEREFPNLAESDVFHVERLAREENHNNYRISGYVGNKSVANTGTDEIFFREQEILTGEGKVSHESRKESKSQLDAKEESKNDRKSRNPEIKDEKKKRKHTSKSERRHKKKSKRDRSYERSHHRSRRDSSRTRSRLASARRR
ncbi:hypothetical protein QAD02_001712 [Eretmocerus hayati]|uniref:Uncharacterized protein n=1 Tax=Eretmocerus hayati TaxID=131215 RepID=A0ACC2NHS2_9HYME|nr:hypothetical protein QAD02_001712 [Eretmocerus hayati]